MVQDRIYNYFERNPQLHVLFIFDRMDIIGSELTEAQWDEATYIYKVFDGAWFNTKYALENQWKDKRVVLLFPETTLPHTEEQMLQFPLLDMLRANMEYKEDDYASFMQQYNLPQKFAPFLKRNIGELMTTKVSNIMNGHFTADTFSEDVACRALASSYLGEKKMLDWIGIIIRLMILDVESGKKHVDFWARLGKNLDVKKALDTKLTAMFGVSYEPNTLMKMKSVAECLKYNSITQLLDAAAGDHYKTYKITNALQLDQINKVLETSIHDRQLGERFANAMNKLAEGIKEENIISCYGIEANYFYMTEQLCWPILKSVVKDWLLADPASVNERMREFTLKFAVGADIQLVIKFVEQLALYYHKVRGIGTLKLNKPNDYVERYTKEFYLIDMFYRHALEAYHQLIKKDIPIEQTLSEAKQELDKHYANHTNILNLEWLTCVNEQEDFFDSVKLHKQQDFYENELDAATKKVVIVCDALRYEVAAELMRQLSKEKHVATLGAMRTMLPTETKYCKPALLPHRTLEFNNGEMAVDGSVLASVDQRTAHVNRYREGALCINYEDVMNGAALSVRDVFKRPMVYIFYNTIDEASHSQSPFEVIRSCRTAVEQLTVLVKRLHATWNVTNVLITSDHGFIYNDIQFEDKDKHSIADATVEKKARYYITSSNASVEGVVKFPIEQVSGMTALTPAYVAVPMGTNRLAAPGGYSFAHGGATLQEMIIPVIQSVRKKADKTEKVGVTLMTHNLNMVSSQLRFQVIQTEAVSMNVQERKILCQIFCGDDPVTAEKEVTLNSTDAYNLNNRVYDITLNLAKSVSGSMLQLRIVDKDDKLNPLIKEAVKNNTIIEQDF